MREERYNRDQKDEEGQLPELPTRWEPRGRRLREEEEEEVKKSPLLVRLIAWASVIAVFFAVGYGGTSLLFKWMDSRGSHSVNLIATSEDAQEYVTQTGQGGETPVEGEKNFTLSIPSGTNGFEPRSIRVLGEFPEEEMQRVVSAYVDALKEGKWFDPGVQVLQVFRSGEWIYLNMSAPFLTSLKALGKEKSQLALTGLVKTLSDNFSQVAKVKFYVDGQEVKEKNPVDLSLPWKLPKQS